MSDQTSVQMRRKRESRTWPIDVGGEAHVVEIDLPYLGMGVHISVDGRRVITIPYSRASYDWKEGSFQVGASTVTVAFVRMPPYLFDVYVGGLSVVDGATLESRRSQVPERPRSYDRVLGSSPSRSPRRALLLALGAGGAAMATLNWPPDRAQAALLAGFCVAALLGVVFAVWSVNELLLRRPAMSDRARFAVFGAALLGAPASVFVALFVFAEIVNR